jgi:ribonuclease J
MPKAQLHTQAQPQPRIRAETDLPLRIIPLGGVGEIGKNMYVFEYGDDIVVIDCGLMFPDEEMFGIDLVIPDVTYLRERAANVKAFLITHAHEDHVGGLPYILPEFPGVPVYASTLARGLLGNKVKEHKLHNNPLKSLEPGDELQIGPFTVLPFRVGHSIPDAMGIALRTPAGTIVHTGDFKFDHTPVDGKLSDFAILARLGEEGVLCLLSDSTRAESPGYTPSERTVGEAFREIIEPLDGRVIVATFASNIARIQQVLDAAAAFGRKVAVAGRSMEQNFRIATDLGYLKYDPSTIVAKDRIGEVPANQLVVVTTGSQGEPMSGLARMANRDHRYVEIEPGDTVIVSASPIPGNEEYVARTIDNLFKAGANVIYHAIRHAHVSGHASQEELKLMLNLTRPKHFIPMHGEFRMQVQHGRLAIETGVLPENVFIIENGTPIELFADGTARRGQPVPAGYVFVDGLSVGDVGEIVLRDRRALANDGMFMVVVTVDKQTGNVIGQPEIITRGFVHLNEQDPIMAEAVKRIVTAIENPGEHISEVALLKSQIKDGVSRYLYEQTKRRPMVFPVVVEV